ncbi:MAG: hypothetical protein QXU64_01600 [Thermofilaceae archaeon]
MPSSCSRRCGGWRVPEPKLLIFVSRSCPHCRVLLDSEMFRRFIAWYGSHVDVVDINTDWGVNLAAQYLQISVEDKVSPAVHRVVRTPMIVAVRGLTVQVAHPSTDPDEFYMTATTLAAAVGLPVLRLPIKATRRRSEEEGERRERARKR